MKPVKTFKERDLAVFANQTPFVEGDDDAALTILDVPYGLRSPRIFDYAVARATARANAVRRRRDGDEVLVAVIALDDVRDG